jgi:hypothetical protein
MPSRSTPFLVKIEAQTLTEIAGYSNCNASKALEFSNSHDQIGWCSVSYLKREQAILQSLCTTIRIRDLAGIRHEITER